MTFRGVFGLRKRRDPMPRGLRWQNVVFGQFRNTEMARDNRYKLVLRNGGQGPNELYDTTADPQEKVNKYNDDQYVTTRDRLANELAAWRKKTS